MRSLARFVVPSALATAASLFGGRASAEPIWYPRAVSAFSSYDGYADVKMHAIVAEADGSVRDITFQPWSVQSNTLLGTFPNVVGVAGYSTPSDPYRHVIVALANGQIWHISYNQQFEISQNYLMDVAGSIVSVSAWENTDGTQNFVVATSAPRIVYVSDYGNWYGPQNGILVMDGLAGQLDISGWSDVPGYGNENTLAVLTNSNGTSNIWTASWGETEYPEGARINFSKGPPVVTGFGSLSGFKQEPWRWGDDDILYLGALTPSSPFGIMEELWSSEFIVPGPLIGGPWFVFPFSIAGAQEINSLRRHAVVALTDGEVLDYFADGDGPWLFYSLGTF